MGCINTLNTGITECSEDYNSYSYSFRPDGVYRNGEYYANIIETIEFEDKIIQMKIEIKCGNQYMDGTTQTIKFMYS